MESSRRLLLPEPIPPPGGSRGLRGDQRLHNDLLGKTEPIVVFYGIIKLDIGVLSSMKVGWRPDSVNSTGTNFVRKLSRCLWYIDPHHEKFRKQGVNLPDRFLCFTGYNDYKKRKEREPRVSSDELNYHTEELSGLLMQPWLSFVRFDKLRRDVENLVNALFK